MNGSTHGTILFGSTPQLEAKIIFGSKCLILLANSFAENPPNTTEWVAPNLQGTFNKDSFGLHPSFKRNQAGFVLNLGLIMDSITSNDRY